MNQGVDLWLSFHLSISEFSVRCITGAWLACFLFALVIFFAMNFGTKNEDPR